MRCSKGLTAAGASVIDTAPAYRQSEEVIGELLADIGNRKQAFVATKVTADNGNLAQGVAMIEESKRRLKTDVLDLVQIHSLNGVDVLFPHLFDLKKKGQIRYVGITTSSGTQHGAMVDLINSQPIDFVQVDYSLANRAAADAVLPAGAGEARRRADQPAIRRAPAREQPVLARREMSTCRTGRRRSTRRAGARFS